MPTVDRMRQLGLINPEHWKHEIHVVGVGATGSNLVLLLAKMGLNGIHVYDFDEIEKHNPPNQAFNMDDIGKAKVEAMAEHALKEGVEITPHNMKVTEDNFDPVGIVFNCVDTMAARKIVWAKCEYNSEVPLYVESRMALRHGWIYALDPSDPPLVDKYVTKIQKTDEELPESPCDMRAISPTVAVLAGLLAGKIIKFAKGEKIYNEVIVGLDSLVFSKGTFD